MRTQPRRHRTGDSHPKIGRGSQTKIFDFRASSICMDLATPILDVNAVAVDVPRKSGLLRCMIIATESN
jgi:hypothetical protein